MCFCPVCGAVFDDFVAGGVGGARPRAACPRCGCWERHRFLGLLIDQLAPVLAAARLVLHVGPEPALTTLLRRDAGDAYLSCDFDPAADGRDVSMQADLTCLPLPDSSVDVLVCLQVLEHIPDDAAAMREIGRVLSPGGLAIINVPYRDDALTDEDPSAPEAERVRRFGQADHVRFYGVDFNDRLAAADLGQVHATGPELLGAELSHRLGLHPPEVFWFVWKGAARHAPGLPRFTALRALS